jgi:hypothetical protein
MPVWKIIFAALRNTYWVKNMPWVLPAYKSGVEEFIKQLHI